jgi:plasmid replication initiation protein
LGNGVDQHHDEAQQPEAASLDASHIRDPKLREIFVRSQREAAQEAARATTPKAPSVPAPKAGRKPRKTEADRQLDFFVPALQDIPVKDGVGLMDIAVFRLSKSQTRKSDIIRYELPDAVVEVAGGAHGMATIYDYDIVLMCISHLADAVRRHRAGRGELPPRTFRPHASEILKFCHMSDGGRSYQALEAALSRLQGTFITITAHDERVSTRRTGFFPLIAGAKIASRTDSGSVDQVEISIPDWIYESVTKVGNPDVLTVSEDYFLINSGLSRFLYRLCRKAAGNGEARYAFRTIWERSGSTRAFFKFCFELRQIIKDNSIPDYLLSEEEGKDGPILRMRMVTPKQIATSVS